MLGGEDSMRQDESWIPVWGNICTSQKDAIWGLWRFHSVHFRAWNIGFGPPTWARPLRPDPVGLNTLIALPKKKS